nr:unnamed protein product [Callosobruchus chinensis]
MYNALLQRSSSKANKAEAQSSTDIHQRWNSNQNWYGCLRLFIGHLSRMFLPVRQMQVTQMWSCLP